MHCAILTWPQFSNFKKRYISHFKHLPIENFKFFTRILLLWWGLCSAPPLSRWIDFGGLYLVNVNWFWLEDLLEQLKSNSDFVFVGLHKYIIHGSFSFFSLRDYHNKSSFLLRNTKIFSFIFTRILGFPKFLNFPTDKTRENTFF